MTEQISIHISDGEPFFAHEATVNFTPTQITMDYKCITPRLDPRGKKPSFQLKHNVIMMDPWHAKTLVGVLNNVVEKYEKEYQHYDDYDVKKLFEGVIEHERQLNEEIEQLKLQLKSVCCDYA